MHVSIDDLFFAHEWLGTYAAPPGDAENALRAERVQDWLEREINRRTLREWLREKTP